MTTTDWIIDIALIFIVLRQMREERLSLRTVLLPLGIVVFVAHKWLHTIPTTGNDLVLVVGCILLGTVFGIAGGLLTKVRVHEGQAYIKAGLAAAGLWVASMTARLGFIIWITHSGQDSIVRFSIDNHLSADVWSTALVLLALSEVVTRIGIIVVRGMVATKDPAVLFAEAPEDREPELV